MMDVFKSNDARLWCSNCCKKQQHRLGNTGEMICNTCGCWREHPEAVKEK